MESRLIQEISRTWYSVAACYLALVSLLGITFNVISIYIMLADKKLRTPINLMLLNIAVADLCVASFGNTLATVNAAAGGWFLGYGFCAAYGYLMSQFGITSIVSLSVLAYERYRIICCPFDSAGHLTDARAKIYVVFIWSYVFAISLPPMLGWGAYETEAANISCAINWETRTYNALSYIIFLFVFALILPVINIIYSYVNIMLAIRKANNLKSIGVVKKAETKVAAMVFCMFLAFLAAWGPYALCSAIVVFTDWNIHPFLAVIPSLFAKAGTCLNPIIYFFLNPQFRKAFCERFGITASAVDGIGGGRDGDEPDQIPLNMLRGTDSRLGILSPTRMTACASIQTTSRSNSPDLSRNSSVGKKTGKPIPLMDGWVGLGEKLSESCPNLKEAAAIRVDRRHHRSEKLQELTLAASKLRRMKEEYPREPESSPALSPL